MAKLAKKVMVEGSDTDGDEEFPSLEVLMRRPVDVKVSRKRLTTKSPERNEGSGKEKKNCGAGESERKRMEVVKEIKKTVKKRVLNQTSDNPLLQRLGAKKGDSAQASDSLDAGPKSRAKVMGVEKSARKQAFAAYLDAEREEQFGDEGLKAKDKVSRKITPPSFTLGDKKETVKSRDKTTRKGEEGTRESTPVEVDEDDLKLRAKATRERKVREPTSVLNEEDLKLRRKAIRDKKLPEPAPVSDLDEDDYGQHSDDDNDGMSDFVVNDSDEESVIETQPPRSVRRLVKGRRPEKDEEDLETRMRRLNVDDDSTDPFRDSLKDARKFSEEASSDTETGVPFLPFFVAVVVPTKLDTGHDGLLTFPRTNEETSRATQASEETKKYQIFSSNESRFSRSIHIEIVSFQPLPYYHHKLMIVVRPLPTKQPRFINKPDSQHLLEVRKLNHEDWHHQPK